MADEYYNDLIELQSLGGLDDDLQGVYDELVSLGEITPAVANVTGRDAAVEAGVMPAARPDTGFVPPTAEEATARSRDTAIDLAKGIIGLPEAAVGMADLMPSVTYGKEEGLGLQFGSVGKGMADLGFKPEEAKQILEEGYTEARKAAGEEFQKAEGIGGKFRAALMNPSVIGSAIVESAPAMIGGQAVARQLLRAVPAIPTLVAAAIGEGIIATGSSAESIRQQTADGLLDKEQAGLSLVSGALTTAFGIAGGKFAQKVGIEDFDQLFVGGANDSVGIKKNLALSVIGGMFSEGVLEEIPQSVQEQMAMNLALDKPVFEGVEDAVVLGGLSGAAMGGGMNLRRGMQTSQKDVEKGIQKRSAVQEALGFDPNVPKLAGQTIPQQFDAKREALATEQEAVVQNEQAGQMLEDVSSMFGQAEEVAIEPEVVEETVTKPVAKKVPTKATAKPVEKAVKTPPKKEVKKKLTPATKAAEIVPKKVVKKKATAGRPPMTLSQKVSKQYEVGAKTDEGFPVSKAGQVVEYFPKKKDAQAWVMSKGTTAEFESAYKSKAISQSQPAPKKFLPYKPEEIQDIPTSTPLPKVGSGHGRKYGKVWYPITGTKVDMTTSSPFQFAIHKDKGNWNITWNGDKRIADTMLKKYGLPINEEGFKSSKEATVRAEKIIRSLVKVYKGKTLTGERPVITNKDLVLKKFGKQNIVVRMKKSLMDYYPVHTEEGTKKVSSLPEYRIYTKFDKGLKQFVYFVQRKQSGLPTRSSRALFTKGEGLKGAKLVDGVQDVKAWLLEKIEKNGYYNAIPTSDTNDIKARLEGLELESGATPAKPRAVEVKVEEPKAATQDQTEKYDKALVIATEAYDKARKPTSEGNAQLAEIEKEIAELEDNISSLKEVIEEELNDDYTKIFGEDVVTTSQEELNLAKDELTNKKIEYKTVKDTQDTETTKLAQVALSAKKAFAAGDIKSAMAILGQTTEEIEVVTKAPEPSAKADVSLSSQIKHHDRLMAAAAETIETTTPGMIGYSQLHPTWSKDASRSLHGFSVYTTDDSKHSVVQYWDKDGQLQYIVAEKRPSKRGYTLWKNGESTPETAQAVKDLQKHYLETMSDVSPFVPGETVTVSEQIQKKTKADPEKFTKYANSLMKLLKLDNLQVFVSYDTEVAGGKGDKYGLYGKYFQYREGAVDRKDALGTLSKPADTKGKYVIQLKSGLNTAQTIRTFLHELGHIVYYEHFSRANSATKRSIVKDWNAWKNSIKLGKVTYNNMQDALEALQNSKQYDKVQARQEILSFNEWFANRVREQVISEESLGGNLVTKFFKRLAKDMTTWVKQVMGIKNERDAVKGFLESIVRSNSLRELGLEYLKESGWEKKATQDASIGEQKATKGTVDVKKTVNDYVKSDHEYKPGLIRNPWSLLDIDPRFSEEQIDSALDKITFDEALINEPPREKMPLDWAALREFAQPYWVKKQFEATRKKIGMSTKEGFSKIFDVAIDSKRSLSRLLEKALKNNNDFFQLKNKTKLSALADVIYELDSDPQSISELPSKFESAMDEDLGYEVLTSLNEDHYTALKKHVMTEMGGANLSEELAGMYVNLRKSLDRALLRIQNLVKDSVKREETDDNALREIINAQSSNQLQAYFPHMRFGDTYITGKDAKGDTVVRYHYNKGLFAKLPGSKELSGKQLAKKVGLLDDPDNANLVWSRPRAVKEDNINNILETPIPVGAMNAFVQHALDKMTIDENVDSAARSSFERTFKQTVASQMNVKKNFLKRQNVAGYNKDPQDLKKVLHSYLTNVYSSINKMETMRQFATEFAKIKPETNPQEWRYADNYISTYFNQLENWVTQWKKLAFTWYLGGRASTAVLNLTQNFITGVQKLNMDTDLSNPVMMKWTMDSARNLTDLARNRGIPLFYKGKRLNLGGRQLSPDEQQLVRELYENNDAQDQMIQEMKGIATGQSKSNYVVDKLGNFMSFAERQNRVSIALTAFRLATKGQITNAKTAKKYGYEAGQKFSTEDATRYAEDVISDTHWHYGKENLPKFFRDNPKWQAIYVFKSFPMNLMLMLREWGLHEGGRGVGAVFGSLMWAALFGGLKGLPFEEELDFIMKKFKGQDWKRTARGWLENTSAEEYTDILFNGLPASVGVDLSGSIGVGFSGSRSMDPHKNAYENSLAFAEGTFGVPGAFVKDMVDGVGYLQQGDYWKSFEKMSPKFLASAAKANRLSTKGLVSKKGYNVNFPYNMEPYKYNTHEALIKTMGFTPVSESKLFAKAEMVRFQEGSAKQKMDNLSVQVSNGSMKFGEAFKEALRWNRKHKKDGYQIDMKEFGNTLKSQMKPSIDKKRLIKKLEAEKLFN